MKTDQLITSINTSLIRTFKFLLVSVCTLILARNIEWTKKKANHLIQLEHHPKGKCRKDACVSS